MLRPTSYYIEKRIFEILLGAFKFFLSFISAQVRPGVHHLGEVEHSRNGLEPMPGHLQPPEGFPAEGVQQPV